MKIISYIAYAIERAAWLLFGYESRNLAKSRRRRAHRLQMELDHLHRTNYARANYPEYYQWDMKTTSNL